ncbi:hypothetical protein, partial [uncultured Porphyromonas sp.]|uniref:hypothetical protein n=1 Tax=uncultured Porphyromonas sp. TaxID=159274 RepID=UPI0026040132
DAQIVRPYRSRIAVLQRTHRSCVPTEVVSLYYNGRTDRASLQKSYRCTTTDAQIVRPYRSRIAVLQRTPSRQTLY